MQSVHNVDTIISIPSGMEQILQAHPILKCEEHKAVTLSYNDMSSELIECQNKQRQSYAIIV